MTRRLDLMQAMHHDAMALERLIGRCRGWDLGFGAYRLGLGPQASGLRLQQHCVGAISRPAWMPRDCAGPIVETSWWLDGDSLDGAPLAHA